MAQAAEGAGRIKSQISFPLPSQGMEEGGGSAPPSPLWLKVPYTPTRAQRREAWEAFGPLTCLEAFLKTESLLSLSVLRRLRDIGIEEKGDLACAFLDAAEAEEAGLLGAWQAARGDAGAIATQRGAACTATERLVVAPPPPPQQVSHRAFKTGKVRRPRKCAASTSFQDEAARRHAAGLAVSTSLSWAPAAGLAARWPDIPPAQRSLFREACIRRLAKFEAKAIYRHLRLWERWRSWAAQRGIPELTAAAPFLDEFIDNFTGAATSARARWDIFLALHSS